MIRTDAPEFGRLITAMITPFDDNLEVDYKALEKVVEHLIATGTDTILVNGTTGESPTLEELEKKELLKAVVSLAKGRAKIIMGSGSNSTRKSVTASQEAEKLGADGLLVVAPYYNKPNQKGLVSHFTTVAQSTSLPIFVYNIPGRTAINIDPETMIEIAATNKNIYAVKDSTGTVDQVASLAMDIREDFRAYSGDDYLTLPFLSVGASGVVSVASHIIGRQIKDMIEAFFGGQLDKARELHCRYLPLFKALFWAPNPTCVKFALSHLGICKPNLRQPLIPLDRATAEKLTALMKELKVELEVTTA